MIAWLRRRFRMLGQRAVWREAHVYLRHAGKHLEDCDPDFARIYRRCYLDAERFLRAARAFVARRR